jgi:4-hydroxybenzoate polyprenyltransferase
VKRLWNYIVAVAQLIRLVNLGIIVLTQVLIRYAIISGFLTRGDQTKLSSWWEFSLLVLATCLIAAGGYIINDYFDVRTDRINKPGKVVIDRAISSRLAIILHIVVNSLAIMVGFYLGYRIHSLSFALIFPCISVLLWFYSTRYKRMLLVGNLVVSLLSAITVIIVWLFEFLHLRLQPDDFASVMINFPVATRFVMGYALFAFLVSLMREIVKDLEDREGDREIGCRTLPLAAGPGVSRLVTGLIMLVTLLILIYAQVIMDRLGFFMVLGYFILTLDLPVLYFLYKIIRAKEKEDFHFLSGLLKVIMLAGVCSMQLISLNF